MSAHRQAFVDLVIAKGWTSGAELGVDKGILFGMLLNTCSDLSLIGVDVFPDRSRSRRAFGYATQFPRRARLMEMTTAQASTQVEDASLDFVFIDADHSDSAVTEDITLWMPKVKTGGWLGGHDYSPKFPGVIAAVNRAFKKKKPVETWRGNIWGVWL